MKLCKRALIWGSSVVLVAFSAYGQSNPELEAEVEYQAFLRREQENNAQERLKAIAQERSRLEKATLSRGRAYVRMMRLGLLPMSDGFESMITHANRVERLRRALARDIVKRAALDNEERRLRAQLQAVEARRKAVKQQVLDYKRSREAVLAARDRELAYRRAFDSNWKPADHAAVYSGQPKSGSSGSFREMKGQLPFPSQGRVEIREVRLESAAGPGALLTMAPGAKIQAVFSGKVVLTGQYGELGNGVVIDHGGGYSTLSARIGQIQVEAGDEVEAGSVLGTLSPDGDGEFYFEVRFQGAAVDPAEWFGI